MAFMQQFSFATLVTAAGELPVATHVPFLVREDAEGLLLTSHLAKANPQCKDLECGTVLVIFTEPHAYISPTHYDHEPSVPTWNYISVHAYGRASIVSDADRVMHILDCTIEQYEAGFKEKWKQFPESYKTGLAGGIVAFDIRVTDLQAKQKLSQNKSEQERKRIIETLSSSAHTHERLVAAYMKEKLSASDFPH